MPGARGRWRRVGNGFSLPTGPIRRSAPALGHGHGSAGPAAAAPPGAARSPPRDRSAARYRSLRGPRPGRSPPVPVKLPRPARQVLSELWAARGGVSVPLAAHPPPRSGFGRHSLAVPVTGPGPLSPSGPRPPVRLRGAVSGLPQPGCRGPAAPNQHRPLPGQRPPRLSAALAAPGDERNLPGPRRAGGEEGPRHRQRARRRSSPGASRPPSRAPARCPPLSPRSRRPRRPGTFGRLQHAQLQPLEGFAGELLQRAERRGRGAAAAAGPRCLLGEPGGGRGGAGGAPAAGPPQDVLDAEGGQRLVGVGGRRELVQGAPPAAAARGVQRGGTGRLPRRGHGASPLPHRGRLSTAPASSRRGPPPSGRPARASSRGRT